MSLLARRSAERQASSMPAARRSAQLSGALVRLTSGVRPPAWTLTAAAGALYVIVAPVSSDLAAAGYRSELFSRSGLTLWDDSWYAGHHLLAYSLLAPGLGALLGVQLLGALSATLAAALFGVLVDGTVQAPEGPAARVAKLWFAFGMAVLLLANRIAYELGLAIGLAALVLAQAGTRRGARRRTQSCALALALAALCALASPVAGAFLALAAIAWALAGGAAQRPTPLGAGAFDLRVVRRGGRALPLALAAAALVPVGVLELAFPEGGTQPFVASAFYPALAGVLAVAALLPARRRVLRVAALLYALALLGAYAIPSAVGGNADRLGALAAGPVLAYALAGRRGVRGQRPIVRRLRLLAPIALAPALLYWQVNAPIDDALSAAGDAAAQRSYYTPLLAELRRLGVGYGARPARIEVVATRDHAEARWVAAHVSIARGWERQLDTLRNGLFYAAGSARLSATRYAQWLRDNAVSYVALPDAPLDYSAEAEGRLVRGAPGYLHEAWRSPHWRLFAVATPAPLAQPPSALTRLGGDSFTLRAPGAGSFLVRVRFTSYWALASGRGCVRRAPGDWTTVQTRAPGTVRVAIDFSLTRMFENGPRCR
ncbi:MAG TPA: hypothetical protein VK707_04340 [Solirubrobacteraceae bacterium]|nr:hypothetical protein [Solirubrobacteraceae bacterium]